MRLFIGLLLLTTQAFAVSWDTIEVGQDLKISQNFQLTQLTRERSMLEVTQGSAVTVKEIVPLALPGFPMMLYILDYKACPGPAMTTDQEIIAINDTAPLVEVGVELASNCELNVYLETKDLYSSSLFE